MSERERLLHSWDANAPAWCDAVREQRIESRRLVTDEAVVDAVMAQHPASVLDAGCGEGWLARALASRGVDVTGIDASQPLIDAAIQRGGARFLQATYASLADHPQLLGTRFDVAVANFSLLDDRTEDVLTALAAVLRPGGRLIVQTVHPVFAGAGDYADGWRVETFASFSGDWAEPMPWYFRTLASWSRAFANAGYALMEIREPRHPQTGAPASILFIAQH